ncbi:MAG: MBOAT family protein [Clostridia bacterium]|nr:MBOAT family protein [Clostridia bacterium]
MIFSSYEFIFLFLPCVLLGFFLLRLLKNTLLLKLWLIAASLVFYGMGQPEYIAMFCFSLVLNYLIVFAMDKLSHRVVRALLMTAACVWNIGLLVYYKYTNFIFENLNRIKGVDITLLKLILPIGISFFTFQILAYTVDFYKGKTKRASLLDYVLFVSFFPQLIVGPVVMHDELMPQLEGDNLRNIGTDDIQRGIYLFSMGCAKKTVLANPLITFASDFYAQSPEMILSGSASLSWTAVLAFTFAYYFDFSGYVDMARGLGYLFGIKLPINFDSPYKARNFADFWRRWNMTISRFFNNTVFSNIFHFGDRIPMLIFATLATFVVSGIWHGAGWNFILWGVVNGIFVCVANIMMLYRLRLPAFISYPLTFIGCVLVRVLFDSPSLSVTCAVFKSMFTVPSSLSSAFSQLLAVFKDITEVCIIILLGALICFLLPNSNDLAEKRTLTARHAVLSAALFVFSLACMGRVSTFLYFNF